MTPQRGAMTPYHPRVGFYVSWCLMIFECCCVFWWLTLIFLFDVCLFVCLLVFVEGFCGVFFCLVVFLVGHCWMYFWRECWVCWLVGYDVFCSVLLIILFGCVFVLMLVHVDKTNGHAFWHIWLHHSIQTRLEVAANSTIHATTNSPKPFRMFPSLI